MSAKAVSPVASESFWQDKRKLEDAERVYHEKIARGENPVVTGSGDAQGKKKAPTGNSGGDPLISRLSKVEQENRQLKSSVSELEQLVKKLELRVSQLEGKAPARSESNKKNVSFTETKKAPAGDDDDVDLFGSDDEDDAAAEELKKRRVEEYAAKKAKKPGVIAKSSVILDVKPWDDETDMAELERNVRSVQMDGLLWGVSKLVPLAYGIKKLQIVMVIEDDKVSVEELTEKLEAFEDFVQSVDVAAFNKI